MPQKKNNIAKIGVLVLSLSLLFVCVKFFKTYMDFNRHIESSNLEQKVLKSQLDEILHKYDSITFKNKVDSLKFMNHIQLLQSGEFKKDETLGVFFKDTITNKAVLQKKPNVIISKGYLSDLKFSKSPKLNALNVNAKGVKIYSDSYKVSDSKIQQLRVCFTLEENQLITSGDKTIYIQVVNPKNRIISLNDMSIESNSNQKLQYSASVNTHFLKKETDVCTYVDLEKYKTIRGKYKINIYHDFVKIGTTIFEY